MRANLPLFEAPAESAGAAGIEATPAYMHRHRILKLRTAEQRRAALRSIENADTRATVRFYIEDYFARLHHRPLPDLARIQIEEGAQCARRSLCKPKLP